MSHAHLSAADVSRSIGPVQLLRPTDLEVSGGECLVVRGPNGSGKSTLLRLLSGRTVPTTGRVSLDGRPVDDRDPAVRAALAAQIGPAATYGDLTLRDHLVLIDATWRRDASTAPERAHAQLAELGVEHLADRFPHELSSGQQQLFQLALVLFRPARVLLIDEPEQRLDAARRERVARVLLARVEAGDALVLACHDDAMTDALADAVLELEPAD